MPESSLTPKAHPGFRGVEPLPTMRDAPRSSGAPLAPDRLLRDRIPHEDTKNSKKSQRQNSS
jgi:hypothetical protein